MTMRELREMPWIGEGPVLDLANTVVVGAGPGREDVDFFADGELAGRWRERAADRALAALPLAELERLRALVRGALEATAARTALPDGVRERLNALAADAPVVFRLAGDGTLEQRECGGGPAAVLARETLALTAGGVGARVRRCPAPSCGMYFLARRRDQSWCTVSCGNRARSTRRQPPA
ncbi:ABATE domain-containing protein [Streptomyces sp. PR69]|uniref:ABATE domain-containing protein n=1 Tax=Streptomyces sp. PR69 TaxID=2984950 RepID=UPI002263D64A|nr:ABATE domain-containing protein [Streptomyces sp. PR69]